MKNCGTSCIPAGTECESDKPCVYPKFKCYREAKCLEANKMCDSVEDCSDGSDELACGK